MLLFNRENSNALLYWVNNGLHYGLSHVVTVMTKKNKMVITHSIVPNVSDVYQATNKFA